MITQVAGFLNAKIKTVIIPDSVKSIMSYAFANSTIEEITIPKSVTSIGSNSFINTASLQYIKFLSEDPPSITEGEYGSFGGDYPLLVPAHSVDRYKSAWSFYEGRIQGYLTLEWLNEALQKERSDRATHVNAVAEAAANMINNSVAALNYTIEINRLNLQAQIEEIKTTLNSYIDVSEVGA